MSSDWFKIEEDEFSNRYVYQPHENRLYREMTQPDEALIYKRNAEFKKIQQRKLDWGRYVASIPNVVLEKWSREYPEMRSKDPDVYGRKLAQLMKEHPEVLVVDKNKL